MRKMKSVDAMQKAHLHISTPWWHLTSKNNSDKLFGFCMKSHSIGHDLLRTVFRIISRMPSFQSTAGLPAQGTLFLAGKYSGTFILSSFSIYSFLLEPLTYTMSSKHFWNCSIYHIEKVLFPVHTNTAGFAYFHLFLLPRIADTVWNRISRVIQSECWVELRDLCELLVG